MALADSQAACASSFSAHGYDAFISSRDELKTYLQVMAVDDRDVSPQFQLSCLEKAATLISLADNMSACASSFNAHGYDAFINARDQLKELLQRIILDEMAHSGS